MPAASTCPDGQPHIWKVSTYPDPITKLYPSECSRCHQKKEFTAQIGDTKSQNGLNGTSNLQQNKPDGKSKIKKKTGHKKSHSKIKSHGFIDRAEMKAREKEYQKRKPEIIRTYLQRGSAYGAAKQLKIPESSLRQLVKRWKEDIEEFKAHPDLFFTRGEIVNLSIDGDNIFARVKIDTTESKGGNLRLGVVEIRCPEENN